MTRETPASSRCRGVVTQTTLSVGWIITSVTAVALASNIGEGYFESHASRNGVGGVKVVEIVKVFAIWIARVG